MKKNKLPKKNIKKPKLKSPTKSPIKNELNASLKQLVKLKQSISKYYNTQI